MRCFAVLGPSGTGKTVLIDTIAKIAEKPHKIQNKSGISLTSFTYGDEPWCAIDCSGSIEAIPDVRYALLASDIAVLCVGPDPDEAVLAAPVIQAIEQSGTPAIIFVNRMDEARARVRDIVAALQAYATHLIVLRQIPIREDGRVVGAVDLVSERAWRYREGEPSALTALPDDLSFRENEARAGLLEHLADFDDALLEQIIEDRGVPSDQIYDICTRLLGESRVLPTLIGAAAHHNGVVRLMKALRHEAPPVRELCARLASSTRGATEPPAAVCFHAFHQRHVGKTSFVRALDHGVKSGATLGGAPIGVLTGIDGQKRSANGLLPGEVGAVLKADHLAAGCVMSKSEKLSPPSWAKTSSPMVERLLLPRNERDDVKLSAALARLAVDDPGLVVEHEDATGKQLVRVQGPMHLRRLLETLSNEFGIDAGDQPVALVYRETIMSSADAHYRYRKQTGGAGKFADVKLTVAPNPRGTGFSFEETVKGGAIPRNYIPAVEAGAQEAMSRGPLGFPVVDVAVTLTDGQQHTVDSSDLAFRMAGKLAVAEALAQANPVLLQPIHTVTVHLPTGSSGALASIVASEGGQVLGFDNDSEARGWDVLRAQLPGAALADLPHALRAATQGVGTFEAEFCRFEELHGRVAEEIVAGHRTIS